VILQKIRDTIQSRVDQVHGKRRDRRQGYNDDWEAVMADLEGSVSDQTSLPPVPQQTDPQISLEEDWEHRNQSQETDTSLQCNQTSVVRDIGLLDSDPPSPSHSREWTVGLTSRHSMSASQSSRLSLSLEESQESGVSLAAVGHRERDVGDGGGNESVGGGY